MLRLSAIAVLAAAAVASTAQAGALPPQIRITEVSAYGSGNAPYAADWIELTNFGAAAVNIAGWRFDDDSASFGSGVALNGVTSIAPGESVVFLNSTTAATGFVNAWFGGTLPSGLQIGSYTGSGTGLSTNGDQVNIYDSLGTLVTGVSFGASPTSNFATFDNAAGVSGGSISQLSVVGVNGAFAAPSYADIGSPGVIPAPGAAALLALGGLIAGRRRRA